MKLNGTVTIDGKDQKVDAETLAFNVKIVDDDESARGGTLMGTQVKETISISGNSITTTVTTTSSDGKTTTTETRTSSPSNTTTTITTTTEK